MRTASLLGLVVALASSSSGVRADSSPSLPEALGRKPVVRRTSVPLRAGWFVLPNGYEITYAETTYHLLMRRAGVKVAIDGGVVAHRALSLQHLENVWVTSDGEVGLEVAGEHFYDGPQRASSITTLGHLAGLYHLARARAQRDSVDEWRSAATADPSLTEAVVGLATALTKRGDRAGALEALLASSENRETFVARYLAASLEPALDWMRDEPRVCERVGPREPPVDAEHITYSPRVGLATWRHTVDSEADDAPADPLMVGTLDGRIVTSAPMDSRAQQRRLARALGDLGFRAARLASFAGCELRRYDEGKGEERNDPACWNRALRQVGATDVRAVSNGSGIALRAGGKTFARDLDGDRMTDFGWLPDARAIVYRVMPRGPCTVGGAPAAESQISFYRAP